MKLLPACLLAASIITYTDAYCKSPIVAGTKCLAYKKKKFVEIDCESKEAKKLKLGPKDGKLCYGKRCFIIKENKKGDIKYSMSKKLGKNGEHVIFTYNEAGDLSVSKPDSMNMYKRYPFFEGSKLKFTDEKPSPTVNGIWCLNVVNDKPTYVPSTAEPTTAEPTTAEPTTTVATTAAPTTAAPTTAAPLMINIARDNRIGYITAVPGHKIEFKLKFTAPQSTWANILVFGNGSYDVYPRLNAKVTATSATFVLAVAPCGATNMNGTKVTFKETPFKLNEWHDITIQSYQHGLYQSLYVDGVQLLGFQVEMRNVCQQTRRVAIWAGHQATVSGAITNLRYNRKAIESILSDEM